MYLPCKITVDYKELPGSPIVNGSWTDFTATRMLRCLWEDRLTLAKELMGYVQGIARRLPHQYTAELSGETITGIYALNYRIDRFPKDGLNQTTGSYKYAKLTVDYGAPTYDLNNLPGWQETALISESLEPSMEFATVGHKNLYWDDNTVIESPEVPGHLIGSTDWVYTIHQLNSLPVGYLNLVGYVNNANVYSRQLNMTFPVETLLCLAPVMTRETTSTGTGLWAATFKFSLRNHGTFAAPKGWNHFPQYSKTGASVTWSRVCYDDSGSIKYVYPLGDFSTIII